MTFTPHRGALHETAVPLAPPVRRLGPLRRPGRAGPGEGPAEAETRAEDPRGGQGPARPGLRRPRAAETRPVPAAANQRPVAAGDLGPRRRLAGRQQERPPG